MPLALRSGVGKSEFVGGSVSGDTGATPSVKASGRFSREPMKIRRIKPVAKTTANASDALRIEPRRREANGEQAQAGQSTHPDT